MSIPQPLPDDDQLDEQGRLAIRCYNRAVPDQYREQVTLEGMFLVGYDSGWSLRSDDVGEDEWESAATTAFKSIRYITARGGFGTITSPSTETIIVGEYSPNCGTFREFPETDGGPRELKGIQMSRYGIVTPGSDLHSELKPVGDKPPGSTVQYLKDDQEVVEEALITLSQRGLLRTPEP